MADDLLTLLEYRSPAVEILALGEPTHTEPAFSRARNRLLAGLVRHGFRSIVVESDRIAALAVDAYVRRGAGDLDEVLATGLTHGLGAVAANRDLLAWLRAHNASVPAGEQVAFHGFDGPMKMTGTPSPGPHLRHLRDFLGAHLDLPGDAAELDRLIGDDERWGSTEAQLDAARSVGRTPAAAALRILADDLLAYAESETPRLRAAAPDDWQRARLHGRTALGLLRCHAVAADPLPPAERTARMLALRDVLMARHLLDIREAERHRGPTLVFAHNRHLQRHRSEWRPAGMDLSWNSAGAIVAATLGERYLMVAGSLGASVAHGLGLPEPDTFEGRLGAMTGQGPFFAAPDLGGARERAGTDPRYFPLDAATVRQADGVWHVDRFSPAAAAVAARIHELLPGVAETVAGPDGPAPDLGWDDHFFFAGEDRMFPFATIVAHDIPGFDDRSRLDRAGVFRVNVDLGRREFTRLFGYGPEAFAEHRDALDFAAPDQLVPHPVYAVQGWASVVNPGERTSAELDRLLRAAHARSAGRQKHQTR